MSATLACVRGQFLLVTISNLKGSSLRRIVKFFRQSAQVFPLFCHLVSFNEELTLLPLLLHSVHGDAAVHLGGAIVRVSW